MNYRRLTIDRRVAIVRLYSACNENAKRNYSTISSTISWRIDFAWHCHSNQPKFRRNWQCSRSNSIRPTANWPYGGESSSTLRNESFNRRKSRLVECQPKLELSQSTVHRILYERFAIQIVYSTNGARIDRRWFRQTNGICRWMDASNQH